MIHGRPAAITCLPHLYRNLTSGSSMSTIGACQASQVQPHLCPSTETIPNEASRADSQSYASISKTISVQTTPKGFLMDTRAQIGLKCSSSEVHTSILTCLLFRIRKLLSVPRICHFSNIVRVILRQEIFNMVGHRLEPKWTTIQLTPQ